MIQPIRLLFSTLAAALLTVGQASADTFSTYFAPDAESAVQEAALTSVSFPTGHSAFDNAADDSELSVGPLSPNFVPDDESAIQEAALTSVSFPAGHSAFDNAADDSELSEGSISPYFAPDDESAMREAALISVSFPAGHSAFDNGADDSEVSVSPLSPRRIPIEEFRSMADSDTTTCMLRGIVKSIRNFKHGNLYLMDGTGEVLIYGIVDRAGERRFPDFDVRKGDTLTVCGRRTIYDRTVIEMKNAAFVSRECGPHHDLMPYAEPDIMPKFKGKSHNYFSTWVSERLRYPVKARESHMEGTVLMYFKIDPKGKLTDIQILEHSDPAFDAEALRIIKSSPAWTPGYKDGHPIECSYTLPVIFNLSDPH